jgi:phosphoglycolate phosphatase
MNLLFDLDGTLTDPYPGITRCIAYALEKLGRPAPPPESLKWCIGPPLKQSLSKLLATEDNALLQLAVGLYRERYGSVGLFENDLCQGIGDMLDALGNMEHTLYVATAKPQIYAARIIDHFGLRPYFKSIYGSELDGTRSDKKRLLGHVLKRESIRPSDAVMIGDRRHDMLGAAANGVYAVGVQWGYGSKEELKASGAKALIADPRQFIALLRKQPPPWTRGARPPARTGRISTETATDKASHGPRALVDGRTDTE